MANKDGVLSIGIEYKSELNKMIADLEGGLDTISKNNQLSKGMKQQFNNVIAEVRSFKATMEKDPIKTMNEAFATLKGKAKIRKIMWSRRAQEYENKINSGNPVAIAEVIRDLYRNENLAEQSYSERQIYEQAVNRLASEVSIYSNCSMEEANKKLLDILAK